MNQPLVRGPLPAAEVNDKLLDPSGGLLTASASLTRSHPLLREMGMYNVASQLNLLSGDWTYSQMGLTVSNWDWRIPVLYTLAEAPDVAVRAYFNAAIAILGVPA